MDQEYSALEVAPVQNSSHMYPKGQPLHNEGKQVVPEDDKYYVGERHPLHDEGKQVIPENDKYYVGEADGSRKILTTFDQEYRQSKRPVRKPVKRKWIMLGGLVLLALILATVLGGVLGSRHHSHSTTADYHEFNSNIAAVSFVANSANSTKLYYQGNANEVMEGTITADNTTWSTTDLGVSARNGSALAAAASRPGFDLSTSVIYLDNDNQIHDLVYTSETGTWAEGTLLSQRYTAMPNSSLSAMHHQCKLCSNTTIIAFQDENGYVQIAQSISDGWSLTQLGPDLDPLRGTGLALQPFYRTDQEDQINLYYQKSNLSLALANRVPAPASESNDDDAGTWILNSRIYDKIPSGSQIAAASSYSNVTTGYESWIQLLYLSHTGVDVNTWTGSTNGWLHEDSHPSPMRNSTSHPKMYESVSVTADGIAFTVVRDHGSIADRIEKWQLAPNFVDWTLAGTYDLSN